ncbi:MAG: hypothetical protein HY547_08900 [Elusimicrobia bacterium]|nr:hypothetical protein [Elusimicrobiota bacterium]
MGKKSILQTVRVTLEEKRLIQEYLNQNPVFESFSALARVATLNFIEFGGAIRLWPAGPGTQKARPSFLWDYDLTVPQAREILNRPGLSPAKLWLIARIVTQARFEEVFNYLDVEKIRRALPKLRLPPKVRERWSYAIERWSRHG